MSHISAEVMHQVSIPVHQVNVVLVLKRFYQLLDTAQVKSKYICLKGFYKMYNIKHHVSQHY